MQEMKKNSSDYKQLLLKVVELAAKSSQKKLPPLEEKELQMALASLGLTLEAALEEARAILLL